ncbi:cellulose binding domain-containing protein [Actinomadura nitritigenes]|uniref:cellulose binding domain-containing protein n=1 Tax=Actinomadura nitritigenes TaxID=134602 RepID=UPI003D94D5B6
MSGDEPGYVPPDHTTTVEFARPARPAEAAATDPPEETGEPEPARADDPDATAPDRPELDDRLIVGPPPAESPAAKPVVGAPSARETGVAWLRRFPLPLTLVAAVLVMAVALGAVSLFSGDGSDGGEDVARTPSKTRRPASGAPAPSPGAAATGSGITYRVVQQDDGYYEGRFVITNRTGRPMPAWRVSFDAPGADVRTVWDARLVQGGPHAVIENAEGADPIPPGGTMDVQFGASGAPAAPRACVFNGAACGF